MLFCNFRICATDKVSIYVSLGINLPIKQHNLIEPQYWEFSQEVLLNESPLQINFSCLKGLKRLVHETVNATQLRLVMLSAFTVFGLHFLAY
jgi:hypothetical protein